MRISKADKAKKEAKQKALRFYNITVNAAREEYYLAWQRVQETREEQNTEEYFAMLQPALNIYNDKKAAANKRYLEKVGYDADCNFKHHGGINKPFAERLKNCLHLARLLSRRLQNLSNLARVFEVSERSVQRYLVSLKAAGFEFKKLENKGGYAIGKDTCPKPH